MIRCAAIVILLLGVNPPCLFAQGAEFTVTTVSASVHKAPSTGSLVIGRAQRGAVLEVTRELGSWVKVLWPDATDGVGYVHVSTGSQSGVPATGRGEAGLASRRASASGLGATAADPGAVANGGAAGHPQTVYVAPPSHVVGVGARTGRSTFGSGVSTRAWFPHRLGVQLEIWRSAFTGIVAPQRVTATQFAPSLLVAFPDRVTDDVMVRPYLGAGPRWIRQSVSADPEGTGDIAGNRTGVQAFGGGEITFAGAPRFTLSADLRYGWSGSAPASPDLGGLGFSLSGHWYVK